MSLSTIPASGLTLHGIAPDGVASKQHSNPAILFKLNASLLEDVKKASSTQGGLRLVTGNTPTIRIGSKSIDLTISPEAFRHELFSASIESLTDLNFAGLVGHRAELKVPDRKQSVGSEEALARLQNTLASLEQAKQANSVSISSTLVAPPRSRYEADRQQKHAHRRGLSSSQHGSPSLDSSAVPRTGAAPSPAATSDPAAKTQAMRTPLIHLLAIKPLSRDDIREQTRIPKEELEKVLQRTCRQAEGKWQLPDKAYKDLDVWKFKYSSQADRQAAIENAIRAFDRLRLGKDDTIWDQLLREEERGKGKVLSRLHLAAGAANRNLTPYAPSPLAAHGDGASDHKTTSAANTPRLGPSATTPKGGSGKSDGGALTKRLFAKDPKKARAGEEAKEKKRREKEAAAAASDKEGSKPVRRKAVHVGKTNDSKVKSAEYVHSSDDDSSADDNVTATRLVARTPSSQPKTKAAANEGKPATNAVARSRANAKPLPGASPTASDGPATKPARPKATARATPNAAASTTSKPAAVGASTPNALPAPSSQSRKQLSPQKPHSRPSVPSPLGAARPRVASDVSDRAAVGVQRVKQGAETPHGLGITNANGARKRHDTITSIESYTSSSSAKMNGASRSATEKARGKTTVSGTSTPKTALTNGAARKTETGVKRKAADVPAHGRDSGTAAKHRKTASGSSQSQKSHAGSVGAQSSADDLERSRSSDSSSSIINDITYSQGVTMAEKFRDTYYPQYTKLYDEQAAMEKRGETVPAQERDHLWQMHRRLETMKREIRAASEREHVKDS